MKRALSVIAIMAASLAIAQLVHRIG
jgi:hypothetical protein